ncbi:MAG: T9SS type A sorting domain-containing protein [Lentimicrobium sp.]|jgi:hypothetical protein|uniref:T9SS type A sorting domain-containing protein n=1 Tax=Lentimicrobium sp. TaxID=2034841 RepID=UPI0025F7F9AE|nr:T9SS type A sorting domain-containing protein [Lentimicrobium sp.]MCO5256912.1 T9SS type A sorting domain-containing protein [Lentimicrobium sp.]MCO5262143.1 T9SS type A sorting domain-containing protein [Lentimicrobium sp.]HPF63526.1 hypothetical protein [Lentimicrobium sp.]HPJ61513.1 hypothetical protein [Lentimicrobium sp.]HRW68169.1 hypothetical protein [Lentimicrobium sp.]
MKTLFGLFTLVFLIVQIQAKGQITITRSDMPDIGDTIRVSTAIDLTGIDPALTGPGYTWDFSSLAPVSQTVEEYLSINSTPFLYQIVFNQNVANLASPVTNIDFVPGFDITDAYVYYRATTGSYNRPGYAATIMGIPVPMKFDLPELLYSFPLQYNSPSDSSTSNYSLGLPGIGYFSIERKRVNQADGWGSLTTPYGTFETLRVKSTIYERDSLYLDSIQTGFPVIRNYIEYQWLGNGQDIPLLTITQEGPIMTARYRDNIQNFNPLVVIAQDTAICKGDSVTLKVKVSGGFPPYVYQWSTGEQTDSIRVSPSESTTYWVLVTDSQQQTATGNIELSVIPFEYFTLGPDTLICAETSIGFDTGDVYGSVRWYLDGVLASEETQFVLDSTGIGLNTVTLRVEYETGNCSGSDEIKVGFYICGGIAENGIQNIRLHPNPATQTIYLDTREFSATINCSVTTTEGRIIRNYPDMFNPGKIELDISALQTGNYLILISDNDHKGVARFIKY